MVAGMFSERILWSFPVKSLLGPTENPLQQRVRTFSIFVEIPPDNHRTNLIKSEHLAGPSQVSVMIATLSPCMTETLNL